MKLIVGLGNPGEQYEGTRHNIGVDAVRAFAASRKIGLRDRRFRSLWGESGGLGLLLPRTYMNRSGAAVGEALAETGCDAKDLLVVHDDLDLALGRIKLDFNAGGAGHRGVESVIETIGSKAFHRVRIGIGRPPAKDDVEGYVLSPFAEPEKEEALKSVEQAVQKIEEWSHEV